LRTFFYVHGWTVYRKEPGKAMRICTGMCGIPQRAKDGDAVMSMDGRYSARSQGRRCEYVHGWTVFRKEPRKAVRICPWMCGISQGAKDGDANMPMDAAEQGIHSVDGNRSRKPVIARNEAISCRPFNHLKRLPRYRSQRRLYTSENSDILEGVKN